MFLFPTVFSPQTISFLQHGVKTMPRARVWIDNNPQLLLWRTFKTHYKAVKMRFITMILKL
jgi:hypothetical protein